MEIYIDLDKMPHQLNNNTIFRRIDLTIMEKSLIKKLINLDIECFVVGFRDHIFFRSYSWMYDGVESITIYGDRP